jgi:chromosome segregation ATPase
MISDLLKAQERRGQELDRLHSSIEELATTELQAKKTVTDCADKFEELSNSLAQATTELLSVKLLAKTQVDELKVLRREVADRQAEVAAIKKERDRILQENVILTEHRQSMELEFSSTIGDSDEQFAQLQAQYSKIVEENAQIRTETSQCLRQMAKKEKKIEELRSENAQLKDSNFAASQQCPIEIGSLRVQNPSVRSKGR